MSDIKNNIMNNSSSDLVSSKTHVSRTKYFWLNFLWFAISGILASAIGEFVINGIFEYNFLTYGYGFIIGLFIFTPLSILIWSLGSLGLTKVFKRTQTRVILIPVVLLVISFGLLSLTLPYEYSMEGDALWHDPLVIIIYTFLGFNFFN